MAPTLRQSTQANTKNSADTARRVGFVQKPRWLPRHKRYKATKGLFHKESTMELDKIAVSNATDSPLLRLPAELRNTIFKYAARTDQNYGAILLIYKRDGGVSCGGRSVYGPRTPSGMAFGLSRVCRQLYAETATLVYSENEFAIFTVKTMEHWLSKRLAAQREVITRMLLGHVGPAGKNELMGKTQPMCPNLRVLSREGWIRKRFISEWKALQQ